METNAELISIYLSYILRRIPIYLVAITSIVLAIIKWRKHSRTSLFLILGFGLYLPLSLFFAAVNIWRHSVLSIRGFEAATIEWLYFIISILQNCTWALMLGFVLAAIFSQRDLKNRQV